MAVVRKRRGRRKGSRVALPAVDMSCRDAKAQVLKNAACSFFLKGGYSCHLELGVNKRGALRADVLAVNLRQQIVVCEIKSSPADYKNDTKWEGYLEYCHRFYFVMAARTFEKLKVRLLKDLKGTGAGVMVLNPTTGYLDIVISAKNRGVDDEIAMTVITRMAWRGGISKRTNRRTRQFLTEKSVNETQEDSLEEQDKEERRKRRPVRRKRRST